MQMLFCEINDSEKSFIKKQLKGHKLVFSEKKVQDIPKSQLKTVECLSPFIYSTVTRDIIKSLPKLKAIATRSTGFDHVDLKAAHDNGVQVANVPFYGENTIAEHTFGLILSLSRNIHKSYKRTVEHDYSIEGLQGFDLKGKKLGVIGVGHIGLHVIRIAKGFDMHVKAYDLQRDAFISSLLHFSYAEVDEILKTSDIITLHLPHNEHTHHFLDRARMKKMKKGALLINTARGGLVDTNALYDLLKTGHLGGAGLDVIEGEEYIQKEEELFRNEKFSHQLQQVVRDERIFDMDNVIFTPHNAFNSKEAIERILQTTVDNLLDFAGKGHVRYPAPFRQ